MPENAFKGSNLKSKVGMFQAFPEFVLFEQKSIFDALCNVEFQTSLEKALTKDLTKAHPEANQASLQQCQLATIFHFISFRTKAEEC